MAEIFFSILQTECIYRHNPKTSKEANEPIDRYVPFYHHERIQMIGLHQLSEWFCICEQSPILPATP